MNHAYLAFNGVDKREPCGLANFYSHLYIIHSQSQQAPKAEALPPIPYYPHPPAPYI